MSPVGPPPAITTGCFVMVGTVPHDPGLAASPRLWHKLEVEGEGDRAPVLAARERPPKEAARKNASSRGGRAVPRRLLVLLLLTFVSGAWASPARATDTIKIATLAPKGSWSNVFLAWGKEVSDKTGGAVQFDIQWNGTAGDEGAHGARRSAPGRSTTLPSPRSSASRRRA